MVCKLKIIQYSLISVKFRMKKVDKKMNWLEIKMTVNQIQI